MSVARRLLLRAEVRTGGLQTISHTQSLSENRVLVRCDEPLPAGQQVTLELSLGGKIRPIAVAGVVVGHQGSGETGDPAAMIIELTPASETEGKQVAELLGRLDAPHVAPAAREYRVLVVDDSEIVRDLFGYGVSKYFRRAQGRVHIDAAGDGLAAWGLLRQGPYDVAIVDYYLPVLDGAKLIARMRADPTLRDVLVIALSVGGQEARQIMLAAGADIFLAKPVVLRDLFATLECLMIGAENDRAQAGPHLG